MPKPLYLERAEELIKLTPILKQRVLKALLEGSEVGPKEQESLQQCLRAALVLKALISDMEEEIGGRLVDDD